MARAEQLPEAWLWLRLRLLQPPTGDPRAAAQVSDSPLGPAAVGAPEALGAERRAGCHVLPVSEGPGRPCFSCT